MRFKAAAILGALGCGFILVSIAIAYPTVYPTGVTINEPGVSDGYALVGIQPLVYLLEPDGTAVHSWTPLTGWTFVVRPLENGHLLVKTKVNATNYGIVELDWNSNVVWSFAQPPDGYPLETEFHHDWVRLDNGNTLILARYSGDHPWISNKTTMNDFIIEVSPSGEIVWEWHTPDHFDEFGFSQERIDLIYQLGGDWSHMNAVSPIPDNVSHGDPRFMPGNLIVGFRYQGIGVIDRGTGELVWFKDDPMIGQHEPTMIPDDRPGGGNILLFDNGWAARWVHDYNRFYSRILEIDPITETIEYEYDANSSDQPLWSFFSPMGSGAQRLPNGNTFITEAATGRVFEITPDDEIVWEFINPYENTDYFNGHNIYRAYKVPLDWASSRFVPDLVVLVSDDADPVPGGTELSYTIQVDNIGSHPAVAAQLSTATPAGTRFRWISPPADWSCTTPGVGNIGSIHCTSPSMSSATSALFRLGVDVDSCSVDGSVIGITVTVTSDGSDATPGDNSTMAETMVSDTVCDDGSLCTVDGCDQVLKQCIYPPVTCTPIDTCHDAGVCDPGTGLCSNPEKLDGTPCDDGDFTTCADSCTDGLCAGTFVPEPAEVNDTVQVAHSGTTTTISWSESPGQFNVYGGSIVPAAPFDYDHACMNPAGPITKMSATDTDSPAPYEADYYLITRVDLCRESISGHGSSGATRIDPHLCPDTGGLP